MESNPMANTVSIDISEIEGKKFIPRAAAYIIDGVFIWLLNVGTGYVTGLILGKEMLSLVGLIYGRGFTLPGPPLTLSMHSYMGIALAVAYFILFECFFSCSLGKLILGMRVVSLKSDALGVTQVVVRALYRILDGLIFGLVAASQMKTPYYQRLGDKQTNTIVVDKSSPLVKDASPWWYFFVAMGLYILLVTILRLIILL